MRRRPSLAVKWPTIRNLKQPAKPLGTATVSLFPSPLHPHSTRAFIQRHDDSLHRRARTGMSRAAILVGAKHFGQPLCPSPAERLKNWRVHTMEYYICNWNKLLIHTNATQQFIQINILFRVSWISLELCGVKKINPRMLPIIWFYLYAICEMKIVINRRKVEMSRSSVPEAGALRILRASFVDWTFSILSTVVDSQIFGSDKIS